MTKKELFERFWIPVEKRLPPDEDIIIYIWNNYFHRPMTGLSRILRAQIEQRMKNKSFKENPNLRHTGYWATHWMYAYPPEGEELVKNLKW